LAGALNLAFAERFRQSSYVPALTTTGGIEWQEMTVNGKEVRHVLEPGTDVISRILIWVRELLPIEWLL